MAYTVTGDINPEATAETTGTLDCNPVGVVVTKTELTGGALTIAIVATRTLDTTGSTTAAGCL